MGCAVFVRTFLIDLAMIDHLIFVGWHWMGVSKQVMPVLCLTLFGSKMQDVSLTDILHNDLGIMFLPPLLDVRLIEPFVVGWHEMVPLQDPQYLLLGAGAAGNDDTGTDTRGQRRRACRV